MKFGIMITLGLVMVLGVFVPPLMPVVLIAVAGYVAASAVLLHLTVPTAFLMQYYKMAKVDSDFKVRQTAFESTYRFPYFITMVTAVSFLFMFGGPVIKMIAIALIPFLLELASSGIMGYLAMKKFKEELTQDASIYLALKEEEKSLSEENRKKAENGYEILYGHYESLWEHYLAEEIERIKGNA